MNNFVHFFIIFANVIAIFGAPLNISRHLEDDAVLSTPELIEKYGYPVEIYHLTTEDGYILEMHRIPHGVAKGAGPRKHKPAVLVMHGVISSSADWIIIGPNDGLGYLLADQGYDVWLGNARGNTYSRKHVTLKPGDKKFWDFSWHEIGIYDLPLMIDFILEKTGKKKIFYIGHSQGCTSFFVMCSIKPEYNDKIIEFHGMAPIAFNSHLQSPFLQLVARNLNSVEFIFKLIGVYEFEPSTELLAEVGALFCKDTDLTQYVCKNTVFALVGFSEEELRSDCLPVIIAHNPAGSSIKQLIHYGQNIDSDTFRQYDYGPAENLLRYNNTEPPNYNLSKITVPDTLYASQGDIVTDLDDNRRLYIELPNPNGFVLVADKNFNHFDYLFGKHVKPFVYDKIIERMAKHKDTA